MPRLIHRPPRYRFHKSTKQAVVSFFGKTVYLGPYGSQKSHERYQKLLREWEELRRREEHRGSPSSGTQQAQSKADQLVAGISPATLRDKAKSGSPVTVSELILVYRRHTHEYYRKRGKVTREAGMIDDVLRVLRRHHGTTLARDFGPVALDELRETMIDELDWSRNHINKQVNRLRAMFKWAAAKEIIEPAVSNSLRELSGLKKGRTRARETAPIQPVADSVIDATLEYLPEVVADMVRIQRLTSARPGEICAMSPGDIDCTRDIWIYRPVEHKTEHFDKDRLIAIGPRAQVILRPYLERSGSEFCFSPAESERQRRSKVREERKTPLSCGNHEGTNRAAHRRRPFGDRYNVSSYRRAIHRICEKHGIEKWSPNRIRHTASTEIRKQFGIDAARAVDGHGSTTTTEIYAKLDLEKAIDVMRQVG